jgi:hypothetical protein
LIDKDPIVVIRNDATGTCLNANSYAVVTTAPCSASNKNQQWMFHAQP